MGDHPIRPNALVTPVDQTHPWFGQPLVVTRESDNNNVFCRISGASGNGQCFRRIELAAITSDNGVEMARAIGKQRHRNRR